MINVAMLWLRNEHNEFLLARRADHKKQDPGVWGPTVTGKLEPGETFEQALHREVYEELGLDADSYRPQFLAETDFVHPDGETRHFKIYVADVARTITDALRIDANEVAEVRWMPIPAIKNLLADRSERVVVPSAYTLWEQIFDALESR